MGPGLVLAAVVLGPGSVTLSTIAGSVYGYRLLWVIVLATVFMITYTLMSARVGLVTRASLFEVTRRKFGRRIAQFGGLFGFLSILAFQAGNSAAVGFSGSAVFGSEARLWSALFCVPGLLFLFLPNLYGKLELLVKVVIGVMVVAFVGTLLVVGVDGRNVAAGLVPGFPDADSVFLALGMAATTFSIAAAAYQNYLMLEKNWGPEDLAQEGLDGIFSMLILGGISAVVLLTSAGVLHASGETVFSAQSMALQLEPVAGPAAFYLFIIGFFFAAFSSMVVNPLIGATLLLDGLGMDPSMKKRGVRLGGAATMLAGLLVVLLFQGSPIELLRLAQGLAVVAFPLLGILIWSLARDKEIMGAHANGPLADILAGAGYITLVGIVLNYLRQILGSA